jgi:hypothetical protein
MADNKNREALLNTLGEKVLEELLAILPSLQFGAVTLIIQNGKVIQIEKNEKFRIV